MNRRQSALALSALVLLCLVSLAFFLRASKTHRHEHVGHEHAGHEALEDLMKENGRAFSALEKGIAKGEWEGLMETAQGIADRADLVAKDFEPPINKEQIDKFQALSVQLSQDVQALKVGLENKDPVQSKKLLKDLEATCISCHKTFVPKKKK